MRKRKQGKRGQGEAYAFLVSHKDTVSDECITWPFSTIPNGYGMLGYLGDHWRAHRLMCILAHGEPPTPAHQAAHECGKRNCVNPRHLSWKTHSENHMDRRRHGTAITTRYGPKGSMSVDQIREIRSYKGLETKITTARRFSCCEDTIRRIQNREVYANVE